MKPVRVKICGITTQADAVGAVAAGADAIGLMFYGKSSRYLSLKRAEAVAGSVGPFVARVGVFVNPTLEEVREAIDRVKLDWVQLHGDEPPEFCGQVGRPVLKAFRIENESSLAALGNYETAAAAFLLDSYVPGALGGTGVKFNWQLAREAGAFGKPIILAGGLNCGNVAEAVRQAAPYGVDVSSGVESAPGIKDSALVEEFVRQAKERLGREKKAG